MVYGSEFMAGRIAVEQIMEIRYMLRALGVPVKGRSYLFADNMSMITSSTIPSSWLKKRHNMLSYHRVREAIASGVVHLIHIPGTENPADVLTKSLVHPTLYALTKPYIFYTKDKHPEQKQGEKKKKKKTGTPVSSSVQRRVTWSDVSNQESS